MAFRMLCAALLLLLAGQPGAAQSLKAENLRCLYQQYPLGVQTATPTLSWVITSDQRNVAQTAYRVLVSDAKQVLGQHVGNVWDSGKILASTSLQVSYAGRPLASAQTYYWQVQVWDNQGHTSAWSAPAAWQMGLLTAQDCNQASRTASSGLGPSLGPGSSLYAGRSSSGRGRLGPPKDGDASNATSRTNTPPIKSDEKKEPTAQANSFR